ncbi:MAG: alkaline phosphatase family protein [Myxococcales bacterium]
MTNAIALRTGFLAASLAAFAACGGAATSTDPVESPASTPPATTPPAPPLDPGSPPPVVPPVDKGIGHVFVILMENHNWVDIKGSASAPYINGTLLPLGSHAENYMNPPGLHPSLPNYIWLEAGTNFGIRNDSGPSVNHQSSTRHLVTLLQAAGITWKSYQEDISGTACPVSTTGNYAPKHNPMVYFDDVTSSATNCIEHVRPYPELARDLEVDTAPGYSFITPNLCNDMHDACASGDSIRNGDAWLAREVPKILGSPAFKRDGVLFITFDEGEGGNDGPIGLIALSRHAKGGGYSNAIRYTHSSLLRTVQHIFKVTPLLGDAANATDLGDLFTDWK